MSHVSARLIGAALLPAFALVASARAEPQNCRYRRSISRRWRSGYFYVGGKYVGDPGKEIMQGQVCVEVLAPKDVRRPTRWC